MRTQTLLCFNKFFYQTLTVALMSYQKTLRGKGTLNPTSTGAFRILGLGPKGIDLPCRGEKPLVNQSKGFRERPILLPRRR